MQSQKPDKSKRNQYDLKMALLDFQILKQSNTLPIKMQIKLQYLQNKLLNRKITPQQYKELPQYQLISLEQSDYQSKKKLFISIVSCLSGKQVIIYFKDQKTYLKKQQGFSMWNKCYITCDSNKLLVKKKPEKKSIEWEFRLKDIKISKKYLEYKKKMCFGLLYGKEKFMVGFDQQSACDRIFKTLKQLIKQKQAIQKATKTSFQISSSMPSLTLSPIPNKKKISQNHITTQFSKPTQRKNSQSYLQYQRLIQFQHQHQSPQQKPHHPSQLDITTIKQQQQNLLIRQQVLKQPFLPSQDKNFKLIKNFDLGRVLLSFDQLKTKTTALLSNVDNEFQWILEQYLDMKSWNLEIEQCNIISKISGNSYKVLLKFKKYSMVSLQRWVYVIATAAQIDKKYYLLIRSCNILSEEQLLLNSSISTVQMKTFNQSVQLCKRSQKDNRILMTIITQADFGGYCSKTDNINMSIQYLMNLQNFYNYLQAQSISKQYQTTPTRLFNFTPNFKFSIINNENDLSKTNNSKSSMIKELQIQSISSSKDQEQKDFRLQRNNNFEIKSPKQYYDYIIENVEKPKVQSNQYKEFLNLLEKYQQHNSSSDKLVQYINSKVYQKHYFFHRFSLNSKYNENAKKFNNSQYDNWVTQKGKWKISGQQLIFIDQQILARQKNVIKYILKQISTNVMAGKSIMNMSLPVEIFEEKSFLQKCAQAFGFLPYYFDRAAKEKNIVKQIQLIAKALVFSPSICPNIQKPFNPILGQTYQCTIGGVNFYFQQICHHPPISAFYVKTQQYQFSGSFHPSIDMGLNTVIAKNLAPIHVHFYTTNTYYKAYTQDFDISGMMFGDRKLRTSGRAIIFEQVNEILCQMSFGKAKKNVYDSKNKIKTGEIIGGIYKVSNNFTRRLKNTPIKNFQGLKYDEKIQELVKIRGGWLGEFFVDDVKTKSMYDPVPHCPVKQLYVLPSDCSYRLDSYYKRQNDLKKAQQWKQILENSQRRDRKLRQQYSKKSH